MPTHAESEASVEGGQPVDLYTFVTPTTTYRMTNAEEDVTFGSTFTATTISRGAAVTTPIGAIRELVVTLPLTHALAQALMADGIPPRGVELTIAQWHRGNAAARQLWRGEVTVCEVNEEAVHLTVPNAMDRAFAVQLPVAITQKRCNHVLYDQGCTVDRDYAIYQTEPFMTACDVVSQTGVTLMVTNMNGPGAVPRDDQWAQYGEVRRVTDGERRSILSQVGTTLTLDVPFAGVVAGQDLEVYAGCDLTKVMCAEKFNNILNWSGSQCPTVNPTAPAGVGYGRFKA